MARVICLFLQSWQIHINEKILLPPEFEGLIVQGYFKHISYIIHAIRSIFTTNPIRGSSLKLQSIYAKFCILNQVSLATDKKSNCASTNSGRILICRVRARSH